MSEFTSGSFHDDDVAANTHRSSAANAECDVVAFSAFSESWRSDVQLSHIIIIVNMEAIIDTGGRAVCQDMCASDALTNRNVCATH
jgi:hypothetical protein